LPRHILKVFAFINAPNLTPFDYLGSELELFQAANNWRHYWTSLIAHLTTGAVLEVGAGIGSVTALLGPAASSWTALEPDETLLATIPESYERLCGTLSAIPKASMYDAILYADVLEHIAADQQEINEAYQKLNPGGSLIVLAPAHQWLFSEFDRSIGHYRRYTKKSLQKIKPNGCMTLTVRHLDSVGIIISAANKLFLKANLPTAAQIRFWDKWIVRFSSWLDPILRYRVGKSILVIWQKPLPSAATAPPLDPRGPCR